MSVQAAPRSGQIDYIEFPTNNIAAMEPFYSAVFGWKFQDYGPDYTSFVDGRISGGFYTAPGPGATHALVVIYAPDLEAAESAVTGAGGKIVRPIFSYPGGRRFQFTDPGGNELAVWSEDPNATEEAAS